MLFPNFKRLSPIQLIYYLLTRCGLLNEDGRPWTVIIATYHSIMLILVGLLTVAKVYKKLDDINEFILPLMLWAMIIHISGKFFYLLKNQRKLRSLLDRLEQLRQEELGDSVYAEHFIKADKINKTILYYLNLNIHLVPVISTGFNVLHDCLSTSETPSLMMPIWIPWEHQKSWPYAAAVIATTIMAFSGVIVFATLYSLLVTITLQLSALVQVLQAKMEKKQANDKSIFRLHINVLQVLQQLNDLLSGQYCLEILLSSLQPCGFCYMLIKYLKSGDSRWVDCLYKVFVSLFATSFLCACGEEINSQVEYLHQSAYRGSWYEEQPAARKDLIILITITSRPLQFQYKGLVTFNLRRLATVIQGFYSYTTMLSNLETAD
ncbi:putative odorant receptor 19b [Rhodnius prolixus]